VAFDEGGRDARGPSMERAQYLLELIGR
jgi:hypothetical protein